MHLSVSLGYYNNIDERGKTRNATKPKAKILFIHTILRYPLKATIKCKTFQLSLSHLYSLIRQYVNIARFCRPLFELDARKAF